MPLFAVGIEMIFAVALFIIVISKYNILKICFKRFMWENIIYPTK